MSKFLIGLLTVISGLVLVTFGAPPSIMQLLAFPQQESLRDVMLLLTTAAEAVGQAFVPLHKVTEMLPEALLRYVASAPISL